MTMVWLFNFTVLFSALPPSAFADTPLRLPPGPADYDREIINTFINSGENGVLFAFNADSTHYGSKLQKSFQVVPGEDFKAKFMVANFTNIELSYTAYLFIDYKQTDFYVSGKIIHTYDVAVRPRESADVSFCIKTIEHGTHDLLILLRRNNDIKIDKGRESDNAYSDYSYLFYRANIFVGTDTFPKYNSSIALSKTSDAPATYIHVSKSDTIEKDIYSSYPYLSAPTNIVASEGYYLHFNNPYNEQLSYSIITMNDRGQTESCASCGAIYGTLNPKNQGSIHIANTNLPQYVWAIMVENPFKNLENPSRDALVNIPSHVSISNLGFVGQ